ncbi:uncharacterized protein LAESUDRAFT_737068 [Laetiporus sulphureus 93-53]|uniref:HIT domain-containing protein n=1 Tax=Laetiporus sulphureus 93-53 TaxID=1314785 RepID=A0A165E6V8_9APHY|nr:uncharacterized protein LAESUDRAFT_737068 [Laetiporus sulphureus 93-53]KZT06354.1 hypothetical protein LAESUDRAFT_737068 [Laetiporus sulphureus 93-53]
MAFPSKSDCSICNIVSPSPARMPVEDLDTPASSAKQPEIVWKDDYFAVCREINGHIVVIVNRHVPSIIHAPISHASSSTPLDTRLIGSIPAINTRFANGVGFIVRPFRDVKIPMTDNLHVHAYVLPADGIGSLARHSAGDLIAKIWEESSYNCIHSGVDACPIDSVPQAGVRTGAAGGVETTE